MSIEDVGNLVRVSKTGHAHTKPFVIHVKIGVVDRQDIELPVDSTVDGVTKHLGNLYLRIWVSPNRLETKITRHFYAFCNGEYMDLPHLACLGMVALGGKLWFVFEDDTLW